MSNSYTINIPIIGELEIEHSTKRGPLSQLRPIIGPPGTQWRAIEFFGEHFSNLPGIEPLLMEYAGKEIALVRIPPKDYLALLHPREIKDIKPLDIQLVQGK